jgi:hypothetical protein
VAAVELGGAIEALHQRALQIEAESKARSPGPAPATTAVVALVLFERGDGRQIEAGET